MESLSHTDGGGFIAIVHAQEQRAFIRDRITCGKLCLDKGFTECLAYSHHFTRRPHLRTKSRVDSREFTKRKYRALHKKIGNRKRTLADASGHVLKVFEFFAEHQSDRNLGQRNTSRFTNERHCP